MSAQTMQFELVSPEEKLISEPVTLATIPGELGELGVGAGHMSLVVALKHGTITLTNDGGEKKKFFITGGFADVTPELCMILAEQAVNVNDIDIAALDKKMSDLNEDLGLAATIPEKQRIREKMDVVKAEMSAAKGELVI